MYRYRPPIILLIISSLIIALTVSLSTVTAFSGTVHLARKCTRVGRDYIVDLVWLNGSFITPLARLNTGNGTISIYGVFSLRNSNSSQLAIRVKNVEKIGNDVFIYVDLVGRNMVVDIPYFVDGNLSIFVSRINRSWISVGVELTSLSADLSYVDRSASYDITDLLQHMSYIRARDLIPIWISNISVKFLVDMEKGSAFLLYGRGLKEVGEVPLLPSNLTLSPSIYSYVVVRNVLTEVNELYSQPSLLEALVAPLKTANNKTQQSRILTRLASKLVNDAIPSYGYMDSVCMLEPLVVGLSEVCNPVGAGGYYAVSINGSRGDARSLYIAAMNNDTKELGSIISRIIEVRRLGLGNITNGAVVLLTFKGPLPEKPNEFTIFYAPISLGNLDAIMLITRGPNTGIETVRDYIEKSMLPVTSNASVSLEKKIINGIPLEVLKITQHSGPNLTAYLWPRDLNGTDYMCISYGESLAPLLLKAQHAWSTRGNEPSKVLNLAQNYVAKFLLIAASKGPRSSKLVEILDRLRSLEAKLLEESKALLSVARASGSATGAAPETTTRAATKSTSSTGSGTNAAPPTSSSAGLRHRSFTSWAPIVGVLVLVLAVLGLYVFRRMG